MSLLIIELIRIYSGPKILRNCICRSFQGLYASQIAALGRLRIWFIESCKLSEISSKNVYVFNEENKTDFALMR